MQEVRAQVEGEIVAVSRSPGHTMGKPNHLFIHLLAGLGVEGDAHMGETVKHRSRVARDPDQPNLRQVHLIHAELFDELHKAGFDLAPGRMGENVTTRGIDLLGLPVGTRLQLGDAVVEVTGLRNPCTQLDGIQKGLMAATLGRDVDGALVRKAGVMGIVLVNGEVRPGDAIRVELPPEPHRPLKPTCGRRSPVPPSRFFDNVNLLRVIDFNTGNAVHFADGPGRQNSLVLEVFGRVGDSSIFQALRSLFRDDRREVLLVLEILLGVEVNLAALFQAILGRLDHHLYGDFLTDLLSGFHRVEGTVPSGKDQAGTADEDAREAKVAIHLSEDSSRFVDQHFSGLDDRPHLVASLEAERFG